MTKQDKPTIGDTCADMANYTIESLLNGVGRVFEGLLNASPALLIIAGAAAGGWYGHAYVVQDRIQKDMPTVEHIRPSDGQSYTLQMYEHTDPQKVLEAAKELGLEVQVTLVQKK